MRRVGLLATLASLVLAALACAAPRVETPIAASEVRAATPEQAAQGQGGVGAREQAPREDLPREPLRLPLVSPEIVVSKGERRLRLYSGGRLVRVYRVGLGLSPVEDKERAGDRRTPEGEFYVFTKNDRSAFHLSLGISYPNAEDAERGLRDRLITRAQYRAILRAHERRTAPPQNTRLGGDIYIHGNGASRDWTWGCVALEDADIEELFAAVPVGTPVRIEH